MTKEEYQNAIPIFCPYRTEQEHMDCMLLCWGIAQGFIQKHHDVEGPHCCHWCDISISAKRWDKIRYKRLLQIAEESRE